MAEWHIPPDYIANNWTDELLSLMIEKMTKRKQGELDAIEGKPGVGSVKPGVEQVSDTELFGRMGKNVKVKKHGN